jgi:thiamine-phosphate pyrophosphorylase
VQYIGLGPLRFTDTKKNLSPIVGLEGYKRILSQFRTLGHNLPVVGIGGVKADDIEALLEAGLHGVAVSSLINLAENPSAVTQELLSLLNLAVSEEMSNEFGIYDFVSRQKVLINKIKSLNRFISFI